jgi:hypothetical protein
MFIITIEQIQKASYFLLLFTPMHFDEAPIWSEISSETQLKFTGDSSPNSRSNLRACSDDALKLSKLFHSKFIGLSKLLFANEKFSVFYNN